MVLRRAGERRRAGGVGPGWVGLGGDWVQLDETEWRKWEAEERSEVR